MHYRPRCKSKTIKLLEYTIRENVDDLVYVNDFLDTGLKALSIREIIDKLDVIKIKICAVSMTISRELEDKPQTWRQYLQKTYLIRDCYLK